MFWLVDTLLITFSIYFRWQSTKVSLDELKFGLQTKVKYHLDCYDRDDIFYNLIKQDPRLLF